MTVIKMMWCADLTTIKSLQQQTIDDKNQAAKLDFAAVANLKFPIYAHTTVSDQSNLKISY